MLKRLSVSLLVWIFLQLVYFYSLGWSSQKLQVITTIFPLQDFARAVGGERIQVSILLPPGTEPHTWEPRPRDIIDINRADIFLYIGTGMEPWAEDLLKGIDKESLVVIEAAEGLNLIHTEKLSPGFYLNRNREDHDQMQNGSHPLHHHGEIDPHIWLDFRNDQIIIDKIVKVFSLMDPEGATWYTNNGKRYKEELATLDKSYSEGLKNCRNVEILLGAHSAFLYLARQYDLKQIALYGMSPDAEPKPRDIAKIIDYAKAHGVKVVFSERFLNERLAKVIADEIGADVLALNPGANITKKERKRGVTFIGIMEDNLKNLMKGLGCE